MSPGDFVIIYCAHYNIFPSEGFSSESQSSVAGYSQLRFPAASQTHLTSGTEGRQKSLYQNKMPMGNYAG